MARTRLSSNPGPPHGEPAWILPAAGVVVAITAIALAAIVSGPHRIGDYYTESDFYGGYASGARLIQQGHLDATRYGVVGPVYEFALALTGAVTRDLFAAAEWMSILSAALALGLWFVLLRRRLNGTLALVTIAFLATNSTFFRYGYSVTTDMLAFALVTAALFTVLAATRRSAPLVAGLLVALATLTRYSAIVMLPGALAYYLWLGTSAGVSRPRAVAMFVSGFTIVALPWLLLAIASGAPPGAQIFHDIAFDIYANARGQSWAEYQTRLQPGFRSIVDVWLRDPAAVVRREGSNLLSHAGMDAKLLLGWPIAAMCAAGLAFAFVDRRWRALAPLLVFGLLFYVALVPAFYAARYALVLAPFYLMFIGMLNSSPWLTRRVRAGALPLMPALACIALIASIAACASAQRETLDTVPTEVLPIAKTLRANASAGATVMALKPQIAFYSGVEFTPLPASSDLGVLGRECRARGADYLYYSWLEANNRPSFWYLLDPAAEVPGLERLEYAHGHPAALYRIGPAFGDAPAWLADDTARARSAERVIDETPVAWRWRTHLSIAVAALEQRRFQEALDHAKAVTRDRPGEALGWRLSGDARLQLNDARGAIDDFERALAIEPANTETRIALGWLLLAYGRQDRAARVWRPAIAATTNRAILERMRDLFHERGDAAAERQAVEALERAGR
jgi:Dolichyl-phosphate-mannose-protein mannosyltransferase